MERSDSENAPLSPERRALFVALGLVFVLAVVEGGARVLELVADAVRSRDDAQREHNLYVEIKNPVPVFERGQRGGREVYRRTRFHQWIDKDLHFSAEKSPDTFRVFCLGGSAAQGWPHEKEHAYPGILAHKLGLAFPDKRIEVINAAGFTYASHRVKFVLEEIVDYEPDLVLIYSGNNEFLEEFVYRKRSLGDPWRRFAVARILHGWSVTRSAAPNVSDVKNYGYADHRANRLAFAFGNASRLREDPEQFRQVQEHYRYNLTAMAETAKARGIPVMLLTVPINLKDWSPNVSQLDPSLSEADRERFVGHLRDGTLAYEREDDAAAIEQLGKALAVDAGYADAHYLRAAAHLRLGEVEAAHAGYVEACATDAYPFRAPPQFDAVVKEVARDVGVPLVDIRAEVDRRAEHGIPGLDVMIDYVHPTVKSNVVIADSVLDAIAEHRLYPGTPTTDPAAIAIEVPEDAEETLHVLRSIYVQYLNMRQYDKLDWISTALIEAAERAARERPEEEAASRSLITRTRRTQWVIADYRRLLRAEKLGLLEQEFTEAKAQEIHGSFVDLVREIEGRDISKEQFEEATPELVYRRESAG